MSKKQKSAEIFFNRIEKMISPRTNPDIIKRILSELHLNELTTNDSNFTSFLQKVCTQSIDLTALLNKVKLNLMDNEPICSLLASIQDDGLISDNELGRAADTLQLQINLLGLFEAFTATMANSREFAADIYQHLMKRRGVMFTGNPWINFFLGVPVNTPLFSRLKMISIDPGVLSIIFHRKMGIKTESQTDVKEFINEEQLSSWNTGMSVATPGVSTTDTVSGMGLNILEATWEDTTGHASQTGGLDNAQAGLGLIGVMEERQYLSRFEITETVLPENIMQEGNTYALLPDLRIDNTPKKISQFIIDKEWRDLYSSWNLLFVIANIDSVLMPIKLLLPTVLAAAPSNYKEVRLLSLFFLGNLFLSENIHNISFFSNNYAFKNRGKILSQWGALNKDYAATLLQSIGHESSESLEQIRQETFGNHSTLNFLKHLINFSYDSSHFRLTTNHQKSGFKKNKGLVQNEIVISSSHRDDNSGQKHQQISNRYQFFPSPYNKENAENKEESPCLPSNFTSTQYPGFLQ